MPDSTTETTPTSYPPAHHFLRDLDAESEQVTAQRTLMVAPLTDAVRDRAGHASVGFLATLCDIAAAPLALIAGSPDWTATADLSLHSAGWLVEGPVVADARLVRAGKTTVVVAVEVFDGHGVGDLEAVQRTGGPERHQPAPGSPLTRAASGLLTFARIPRAASAAANTFDPASMVGQRRRMAPLSPPGPGILADRIGLRVVDADDGVVELDRSDYVRNSFGTINGGVLGVVFQAAAEAAHPELVATDLQIHYLAQSPTGPARTHTVSSRIRADHAVCTVEAVDAGADDLLLSMATVTLQRPPR